MKAKRILTMLLILTMTLSGLVLPVSPALGSDAAEGWDRDLNWAGGYLPNSSASPTTPQSLTGKFIGYDSDFTNLFEGFIDQPLRITRSLQENPAYAPTGKEPNFRTYTAAAYTVDSTKVHSGLQPKPAKFERNQWNHSYNQLQDELDSLEAIFGDPDENPHAYVHTFRVEVIGQSELGRDIPAIVIGSDTARNSLLIVGGQQGTDWANPLLLMKMAEFWLWNSRLAVIDNEKMSDFWSLNQFVIVPMANPDGIMLGQEGLDSLTAIQRTEYEADLMAKAADLNDSALRIPGINADSDWTAPAPSDPAYFTYWDGNLHGDSLMGDFSGTTAEGSALMGL